MSARIARGGSAKSRGKSRSQGRSTGRGRNARKQASPNLLDAVPAETVRKLSWWLFLVILVALGIAAAAALEVPRKIGLSLGEAAANAGFEVKRVEIRGLDRMERLPVYAVALDQDSMAMPLVDLAGTRERLLHFGWIEEARVSRRLPDTLVVDVVERRPAAIWQHRQRLSLIDRHGVVLEPVQLDAMPNLPLVIGEAANHHASELGALLDAAPRLEPMLEGASWVGGRRWDLRFRSGEVLALPEGQAAAKKALVTFARMDAATQLLGRGLVRFDMRIPGKFVVRVTREPGSTVPVIETPAPPAGGAPIDATKTI